MLLIKITTKEVYGEKKAYPSCEKAKIFAAVAGTKTLTPHTLGLIEALGYKILDVTPSAAWGKLA